MTGRRHRLGAALLAVGVMLGVSACGADSGQPRSLPTNLVPTALGGLVFSREPKAEAVWSKKKLPKNALISSGRIYTVRDGTTIQGDIQVAVFTSSTDTSDLTDAYDETCTRHPKRCSGHQALIGMNATLGESTFRRLYIGDQRVYEKVQSDLRMYLWFPPKTQSYVLLVLRKAFTERSSEALLHALVDYQAGRPPGVIPLPSSGIGPTSNALPSPDGAPS